MKVKIKKWFEEYKCGCVSPEVSLKKDLIGYCTKHGENCRHIHQSTYHMNIDENVPVGKIPKNYRKNFFRFSKN